MNIGTVLCDRTTGLRVMVVDNPNQTRPVLTVEGRQLHDEALPKQTVIGGLVTTDPGMRG